MTVILTSNSFRGGSKSAVEAVLWNGIQSHHLYDCYLSDVIHQLCRLGFRAIVTETDFIYRTD